MLMADSADFLAQSSLRDVQKKYQVKRRNPIVQFWKGKHLGLLKERYAAMATGHSRSPKFVSA